MPTVAVFAGVLPDVPSGGAARLKTVLKVLGNLGFERRLLLTTRQRGRVEMRRSDLFEHLETIDLTDRPWPEARMSMWRRWTAPPHSLFGRLWLKLRRGLHPVEPLADEIARRLQAARPDLVWVHDSLMAPVAAAFPADLSAVTVLDTLNILHLRDRSFQASGLPLEFDGSPDDEAAWLRRYDWTLAVQSDDAAELSRLIGPRRVLLATHAVEAPRQTSDGSRVVFLGSNMGSNAQGAQRFVEEAWPLASAARPSAVLELYGKVCKNPGLIHAVRRVNPQVRHSIRLMGPVDDVLHVYRDSAVVVCPVWAGGGLKIKLAEALAHGKAVVATGCACEGLDVVRRGAVRRAETPAEFAQAVLELLSNPVARRRLETAAHGYAQARFSLDSAFASLRETVLDRLSSSHSVPEALTRHAA